MSRAAIVIALWAMAAFAQTQPPLTSDSSKARLLPQPNPGVYPGRAAQYVPPVDDMLAVFHTNYFLLPTVTNQPSMLETVITSNVVRRTRWWNNGFPATNDLVMSSNLVSRTTNVVDVR